MLHKISDLTKKVSIMYDKSLLLHRLKYDTPKHDRNQQTINMLVADIQSLAGDIYNDRTPYPSNEESDT